MSLKIKKGDEVIAIAGREASGREPRRGRVLAVFPRQQRVLVEGFRVVKKHLRKSQDHPQGAIIEREAPLHISNVALYCPKCARGVRVGIQRKGGNRLRVCRKCGHDFGG